MQLTNLATLLLASGTSLAAPAPAPAPPSNTATCSLKYGSYYGTWTVLIGRPFVNGAGCPSIKAALKEQMTVSSSPGYKCEASGSGTKLTFSTNSKTKKVNQALQKAYPMIPFVANSICDVYNP